MPSNAEDRDVVVPPPIKDVLVFERLDTAFRLIGGSGRGAGWAGLVEVSADDGSLVARSWRAGLSLRCSNRTAQHIAGPYHARHAIAIPVGQDHVVVLGADRKITLRDGDLLRLAADIVARTDGVPAHKLLADELELVHAIRTLMAYRPQTVRETMRHVAAVSADSLSCEVAAVRVEHDGTAITETYSTGRRRPGGDHLAEVPDDPALVAMMSTPTVLVEQSDPAVPQLVGMDVVARLTLPLGSAPALGALALGHAAARPRGFTSLCQRIGRALAEAAELLISQAIAREQLAADRDRLAFASRTDALTGIGNRRAWDTVVSELAGPQESGTTFVLSCDLDDLKRSNDRFGHAAGDEVIRSTAELLRTCIRANDLVARLGGDEFAVLLRDADQKAAAAVRSRIQRACLTWPPTPSGLRPKLSIGLAVVESGDVELARAHADRRMYAAKRRRATAAAA